MKSKLLSTQILMLVLSISIFGQSVDIEEKLIPKNKIGASNSILKLNGFYYNKKIRIDDGVDTTRAIAPIAFFKNGSAMRFHVIGNNKTKKKIKSKKRNCVLKTKQNFNTILDYFQCYFESIEEYPIHSIFSIDGNIIRIQSQGDSWFFEQRGLVLTDSTFLINKRIDYLNKTVSDTEDVYYLKVSNKPDSLKFIINPQFKTYFLNK